jgi:Tol biopolymer transport system component
LQRKLEQKTIEELRPMKFFCEKVSISLFFLLSALSSQLNAQENSAGESQFLSNTRQLIYDGARSGEGYFSPDGKALIFQSERLPARQRPSAEGDPPSGQAGEPGNPFFQIYILDLESGDSHRVSPGIGKTTCAFFRPNSDEVLFASSHLDPEALKKQQEEIDFRAAGKKRRYIWDYDEQMDIFSANRDGSNLKRLTDAPGYDAEGSYSPDGSKIVFCSTRDGFPIDKQPPEKQKQMEIDPAYFGEIYIMNADGSDQTRLTNWPGYDGGPFFTPDGERIVWRHFEENGVLADVYTMRLDGSEVRRLTEFGAMSWAPYFHPSMQYVIFASNKLGFSNFELFMVDALGEREPVRVTFTEGFDGLPVFSPDGKQLCWTSNRTADKKSQLFIASWNHEAALAALAASPERGANGQEIRKNGPAPAVEVSSAKSGETKNSNLSPEITAGDLQSEVRYLASDALEGRMTGSAGIKKAAEHIVERFKSAGLKPFGDDNTFLQQFEFTSGMELSPNQNRFEVTIAGELQTFEVEKDFMPLAFTANGEVAGEVVFAGYGLKAPGKSGQGYDSYAGLDVKDKIVLVLRYVPEAVEMRRRQELNVYAGLRYKAMMAREHGAKALLVATGPNSPNAGEVAPLSFDRSVANSGIVAVSISGNVAEAMFAAAQKNLKEVQSGLDQENPHFEGTFALPNVKVKISAGVERIKKNDHNVVGLLPASASDKLDEYVVIGAHYDHIGFGEIGSLARKGEEGQIHNGADDNASGTATVLELMAALAEAQKQKPEDFKRNLVAALWSGEELGLIGSQYFVDHAPLPMAKVAAYINFDMVGRLRDNNLILQGLASSTVWPKLIEKRNVAAGFNLTLQDDPYLPTDVTAFYPKGAPVLAFFTGSHEDYNRPTDDAETLNYDGMERIGKFARGIILDLLKAPQRPDYVKVERTREQTGQRENLRAYLGTVPDYTDESVPGVKLSGVRAGGPADKAGLKAADVIIEFAGQKITNIYDYTYALDAVKIGEPIKVVALRGGQEVTLTVIPEARE